MDKSEVYIISENRITDECIAAVKNENENESEDEKSLLRKCLLVYMTVFSGLWFIGDFIYGEKYGSSGINVGRKQQ